MQALLHDATHWECPKCTLLCPVKFHRCTMCLYRRPRAKKPITPTLETGEERITPETQRKTSKMARKNKVKTKRHISFRKNHGGNNIRKEKAKAITSTTKRNRDRVDKGMAERKKKKHS